MFAKPQKFTQFRQSDLNPITNRSRFVFGDGDDSIDRARNIRFRNSSFQDGGRVRNNDRDYYRFTLNRASSVEFNFQNRGDDLIRFSVVDRRDRTISVNGNRLFADVEGEDRRKFSTRLSSGTFFIRVETPSRSNEQFNLRLRLNSNFSEN